MAKVTARTARVTLIAEVSTNAGRSMPMAELFIGTFAAAGADIVKFQLTRAARLARTDQQRTWFEGAEWDLPAVKQIRAACRLARVQPMFTVYHADDAPLVAHHRLVKIGSGEAHEGPLAAAVLACPFEVIYVSEGILPVHQAYRRDPRVVLMGASPHYPAPRGVVGQRFVKGRYQGWSDHSIGLDEAHLAVLLGATAIERHVQLPQQVRPPKEYESTAAEFAELRRRVDEDPKRFLGRWSHLQAEEDQE